MEAKNKYYITTSLDTAFALFVPQGALVSQVLEMVQEWHEFLFSEWGRVRCPRIYMRERGEWFACVPYNKLSDLVRGEAKLLAECTVESEGLVTPQKRKGASEGQGVEKKKARKTTALGVRKRGEAVPDDQPSGGKRRKSAPAPAGLGSDEEDDDPDDVRAPAEEEEEESGESVGAGDSADDDGAVKESEIKWGRRGRRGRKEGEHLPTTEREIDLAVADANYQPPNIPEWRIGRYTVTLGNFSMKFRNPSGPGWLSFAEVADAFKWISLVHLKLYKAVKIENGPDCRTGALSLCGWGSHGCHGELGDGKALGAVLEAAKLLPEGGPREAAGKIVPHLEACNKKGGPANVMSLTYLGEKNGEADPQRHTDEVVLEEYAAQGSPLMFTLDSGPLALEWTDDRSGLVLAITFRREGAGRLPIGGYDTYHAHGRVESAGQVPVSRKRRDRRAPDHKGQGSWKGHLMLKFTWTWEQWLMQGNADAMMRAVAVG